MPTGNSTLYSELYLYTRGLIIEKQETLSETRGVGGGMHSDGGMAISQHLFQSLVPHTPTRLLGNVKTSRRCG